MINWKIYHMTRGTLFGKEFNLSKFQQISTYDFYFNLELKSVREEGFFQTN